MWTEESFQNAQQHCVVLECDAFSPMCKTTTKVHGPAPRFCLFFFLQLFRPHKHIFAICFCCCHCIASRELQTHTHTPNHMCALGCRLASYSFRWWSLDQYHSTQSISRSICLWRRAFNLFSLWCVIKKQMMEIHCHHLSTIWQQPLIYYAVILPLRLNAKGNEIENAIKFNDHTHRVCVFEKEKKKSHFDSVKNWNLIKL